jgi:hypothetical protein
MSEQKFIPKEIMNAFDQKAADAEETNRQWRIGQMLSAASGSVSSRRVVNWGAFAHQTIWR